jgi:cytochrome bd-type quinol oxidase subunit 2
MKYSQWIGVAAAIVLVIACFLPWTYHPDLDKNFTGFFSQNNIYGKPGYFFIVVCIIAIVFFLIQRVWAKRWNLFICAIILSYAIKSFIVFSGCYRGICPDKKAGLWIMLLSAIVMLAMTMFPDIKLKEEGKQ